jgi:predicted small secreted protein
MRRNARLAFALFALAAAAPILSACYTTRGAGEDLSAAGQSISHAADRNTDYKP